MINKKNNNQAKIAKKLPKLNSAALNYPIGDFLIRVKNAYLAKNRNIELKNSKLIESVAKVMEKQGFLEEVKKEEERLLVKLAFRKKEPVILGLKLVSSPGLRVYKGARELQGYKGPSTFIASTSQGVMTSKDAIKKRLGGEVIAEIW